jgi:hypothetical protein
MFAREKLSRYYSFDEALGTPVFDFVADDEPQPIMTRHIGLRGTGVEKEFWSVGKFQITYNFSSAARDNWLPLRKGGMGTYGEAFSYRLLYEYLSGLFNGGEPFIDTYFQGVWKTQRVYRDFLEMQDKIRDDINNEQYAMMEALPKRKDGLPDMRYAESRKYLDFKVWQDPVIKENCDELAEAIRANIIACLRYGVLVRRRASDATMRTRRRFRGLHPDQLFYASGRLIEHLNIFVEIAGGRGRSA